MTNQEFGKLPKAEQRVEIAKDVIKQIIAKKYRAYTGNYVSLTVPDNLNDSAGVQENFEAIKKCNVCAIGGCLMSAVKFKNHLNFQEVVDTTDEKTMKVINSLFSQKQLGLIEIAFEGYHSYSELEAYELNEFGEADKAEEFYYKYNSSPDERLIKIMENIIHNKGRFRP